MQTSPSPMTGHGTCTSTSTPGRLVVDAPTRMFHGLFALTFIGAYVTADSEHWRLLHVTLGYAFGGLAGFRVMYGLVGPRHAGAAAAARLVEVERAQVGGLHHGHGVLHARRDPQCA